ncbi:ABC transporter ATP-binding protein [Diaphorobacter aerolatus]|uniref:ABC transporter ATP-binding protein n=1 Tax=Diaphorobacter aerolatus TaxID=1288495 RepID=A0A7H0GK67_9BURK|nr:ABC transporter ATP-binding protein [Diaphorobacter aerolatus]QNP48683.1 ABC transporter ATP-binding protein [Diaphorobacter aerolatus]
MLQISQLHAWYGKSHVLHGVNLHVSAGEIVALLGRNGSGRSTLAKAVMAMVPWQGEMQWNNQRLDTLKTFEIARQGIGYVPESRDVFSALTVQQNLMLGIQRKPAHEARWSVDDMYTLFPQLGARRNVAAGLLSGGEQQMLTLCRTLMGDPQLIIIDEPTEGLAPMVVQQLAHFLARLRDIGIAVLLIEQKLSIALEIADRVLVMGRGEIVFEGSAMQLRADTAIRSEWLEPVHPTHGVAQARQGRSC